MISFLLAGLLLLGSFQAKALESTYEVEKEINLSLENAARLSLEKVQLEEKITDLQKKIKEKKISLLRRSSALSHLKKYQWGALLSRAESSSQLERNIKIFSKLNEYDLGLFKDYVVSLKMLGSSRSDLEATLKEISNSVEKMKQQQQELALKETSHLSEIKSKNLSSLINLKGQLARPLDGRLLWNFGTRIDDSRQYVFVSKGMLYKTNSGNDVKSVGPGVIIFSDVVERWRETLIIQHEDNYYSVYSGLKSANLRINDSVEKDQVLGMTNSDEFYFELRHFDSPINPKNWFKESL